MSRLTTSPGRAALAWLAIALVYLLVWAAPSFAASIPPANTALPTISGTALDEDTLTASPGTWSGTTPITYAYTWQSCNSTGASCTAIAGATASTYTITTANAAHTIRVSVLATNSAGSASAVSAPTAVVPSSLFEFGYDDAGRLIEASDPAGNAAIYKWDAAGDLLSISRQASATVAVTQVTPQAAPVGATVTIYGTGFSPTAAQDTVTINGTSAKISSASATQLVVTVPAGATTGVIKVTAPAGSASSAANLTVGGVGAPTISSVTSSGSTVTVAGTNFSTTPGDDALVLGLTRLKVTAATATSLTASFASVIGSGNWQLATPGGVATGPAWCEGYAVLDQCSPATLGTPEQVTIKTAGHSAELFFAGKAGQQVSVQVSSSTLSGGTITLLDAYGSYQLAQEPWGFLDPTPLPVTGTYTLVLSPTNTGSATVTIANVPASTTYNVTPSQAGAAVSVSTVAGQGTNLTFSGTAGERVYAEATSWKYSGAVNAVAYAPDGTTWDAGTWTGNYAGIGGSDSPLPQTGQYRLSLDPMGNAAGSMVVTFYVVPADASYTATPSSTGNTVSVSTSPGQNASVTFQQTAGERFYLWAPGSSWTYPGELSWTIYEPNGAVLSSAGPWTAENLWYDMGETTLAQAGTYKLVLNTKEAGAGAVALDFYQVAADSDWSSGIGYTAAPVDITTPGQNGWIEFSGTDGQVVDVNASNVTIADSNIWLYTPSDTWVSLGSFGTAGGTLTTTLTQTGTFWVYVDPQLNDTGTIDVTLTDPPAASAAAAAPADGTAASRGAGPGRRSLLAARVPAGGYRGQTVKLAASSGPSARLRRLAAETRRVGAAGFRRSHGSGVPRAVASFRTSRSAFWSPGRRNFGGGWDMKAVTTPWTQLVPRADPDHGTELAGQVLKLNGLPLAGVRVSISGTRVASVTDATGRFLLTQLPAAGHQVLDVDGSAAGTTRRHYARFEIGVDLKRNRETVLAFTLWLPQLDSAHTVRVTAPLRRALVLRTPHIPGLEVKIPAGSTITGADGKPITRLSVIPVPVDRPPFPLPLGSDFPIYLSVQPADAYVSRGAEIIYPNYAHLPAGQRVPFWNYNPATRGWYIYGSGTVSRNRKQIIPSAGTRLWQFTGAMVSSTETPPSLTNVFDSTSSSSPGEASSSGADPVNLGSGLFTYQKTDLELPDVLPISDTRVYRPADPNSYSFGVGTASIYDMRLYSTNNYFTAELILPNGTDIHYQCVENCSTTWNATEVYRAGNTPSEFYGSEITVDKVVGGNGIGWFNLRLRNGLTYVFSEELGFGLEAIRDRFGNQITIVRNSAGLATQVTSPNGRWLEFTYDSSNRIIQATDNAGRVVKYSYNSSGQLDQVTAANGNLTTYTYGSSGWLTKITDGRGNPLVTNVYDSNGRVVQQAIGTESTPYTFSYTLSSAGQVTQSTMTSPNGNKTVTNLNADGYPTSQTFASGTSLAETTTYARQAGTDLITSETDPLGRITAFTYDAHGNVASITQMSGTASARKTSIVYDPVFSQPTSVTDPLGKATVYGYDSLGELTSVTDPLLEETKIAYATQNGQATSVTDPAGNVTKYAYVFGDLASVTDPDGAITKSYLDAGGRLVQSVDPLGNVTTYGYDVLNDPTSVTDPAGDTTQYTYDADGDLDTIKDARGNTTTFTYDAEDRLLTRTDALAKVWTYGYDNDGNLVSLTDAKGQKITYAPDALDRLSSVSFTASGATTPQSTVAYTYDLGDRLTKVVDSTGGTFTETPDSFDELTEESGPKGSISYTYDADGRRITSTVAGQTQVTYGYDSDSHLTAITQGSQKVALAYDTDGRLQKTTLPDGITENYAYDPASRLTDLTYDTSAAATLGHLHYTYDPGGDETSVSGSYARLTIPAAWGTATYNADNALTALGSTTYTYDADGNLTSNGASTYTWNVRSQLTGVTTGSTADSFTYDPFGRREQATINGTTTGYLYDGLNVAQDLSGTTAQTSYLLGLGLDQRYARTDSTGTQSYLTDPNGSTVALAGSTESTPTSYTYDPFGQPTAGGAASSNPYQYAGEQNDGDGLQYNLARYYAPGTARFISQDPTGFAGSGTNLYQYADEDPVDLNDPSGTSPDGTDAGSVALNAASSLAGPKDGGGADGGAPNAGGSGAGGGEPPDLQAPPAGEEPPEGEGGAGGDGDSALNGTNAPGEVTSRGTFRVGTVQDAWDNAGEGPSGGRLCPTCGTEVNVEPGSGAPRDWDVSHNPSWTNREFPPDVTRPEVQDNYQQGTSLECPSCNRGGGNNDERFSSGGAP